MKNKELIFSFTKKDFKVDYYRGSGPGGQHRNKRDTACRITHIESGLTASAEDSKSQHQNKSKAFKKLCDKLLNHYLKEEDKKRGGTKLQTARRTYNESNDLVTDHKTGEKFSYKQTVGKNDLSDLITSKVNKNK